MPCSDLSATPETRFACPWLAWRTRFTSAVSALGTSVCFSIVLDEQLHKGGDVQLAAMITVKPNLMVGGKVQGRVHHRVARMVVEQDQLSRNFIY